MTSTCCAIRPRSGQGPYTAFATGLQTYADVPSPRLAAFTMPLYLPVTTTASGHPLEVWGCVRPATTAARTTHRPQFVQIQFRRGHDRAVRDRGPRADCPRRTATSMSARRFPAAASLGCRGRIRTAQ